MVSSATTKKQHALRQISSFTRSSPLKPARHVNVRAPRSSREKKSHLLFGISLRITVSRILRSRKSSGREKNRQPTAMPTYMPAKRAGAICRGQDDSRHKNLGHCLLYRPTFAGLRFEPISIIPGGHSGDIFPVASRSPISWVFWSLLSLYCLQHCTIPQDETSS